jgi:uncharacterized membrane protein (DUF373 family)
MRSEHEQNAGLAAAPAEGAAALSDRSSKTAGGGGTQGKAGPLRQRLADSTWYLTLYERFEQAVIVVVTVLIMLVVVSATWHLAYQVASLILTDAIDPSNQPIFQTVFGMVFTVIIALEFKHSLLVSLARQESVVRLRSIILIAMLAMARKFIIVDLNAAGVTELFGLSTAILALGVVYWLVRDQDQRLTHAPG